jgi:hypothetical protein
MDLNMNCSQGKPNDSKKIGIFLLLVGILLFLYFQILIIQVYRTSTQEIPRAKLFDAVVRTSPTAWILFLSLPYILSFGVLLTANIFLEFIYSIKRIWKWPLIITIFVTLITIGTHILDFENAYMVFLLFLSFLISNFVYQKKDLRFKFIIWIFGIPFFFLLILGLLGSIILNLIYR